MGSLTPHPDGRGAPTHHHDWEGWSPPSDLDRYFSQKTNGTDLDIREVYRFELNRLNSYIGWPKSACAYPTKLARAGFYYLGNSDVVACYVCNVQVGQWERADVPWKEHKRHSPRCPFVLGTDKTNVPLLSAGQEGGACAATNDGAEHEELTAHGAGEVFDGEEEPKSEAVAEAVAEFEKLLEKYPYTSLNTDKVKAIIERYKQQSNGRQYLDLPKDIAVIEFQSLLEKYPYSSLNIEKIQGILSNFKQNITDVQKNGVLNKHGMPKNGFHRGNAQTNNVAQGQAHPSSQNQKTPSETGAAAPAETGTAAAAASSIEPLRVEDKNPTLDRRGHGAAEPHSAAGTDGPQTQPDAVPFTPTYNQQTAPRPQPRRNNDISIISEALRQIVSEPVQQGATEYCPPDVLSQLVQYPSAQNAQYAHINKRLVSFAGWPYAHMQNARGLAEAGFFYTGREDRVRCWFCNGGLCNWEREDIPWYEHDRWFGQCQYVLKCKEKSAVVEATIETAKHINTAALPPTHCHHHGHNHQGQTQCDTEKIDDIWNKDTVRQAMEMGYSKNRIQVVVNSKGYRILNCIEDLVDALIEGEPEPEPEPRQPEPVNQMLLQPQTQVKESQQTQPSKPAGGSPAKRDIPTDLESLRKENEELRSANLCKVCLSEQISIIFLPCSHLVCCLECGMQLQKCPLCRQAIKATSRVFL